MLVSPSQTELPAAASAEIPLPRASSSWLRRWAPRLATFFVGQGAVQALGLLTGFFLLRWLSVEEYAIYTFVNGFLGTSAVLVDQGIGGSIVALLAGRTDKATVGGYIRSARHCRDRFLAASAPVLAVSFYLLASRQGVGIGATLGLFAAVIATLYFQSWASFYGVPFVIHQELSRFYQVSTIVNLLRLGTSFIMHVLAVISAQLVVWTSALITAFNGWFYRRQAVRHLDEPHAAEREKNREVMAYLLPLMPGTIFFAFQGQIGVLLITWFGKTESIAEVGALGRIAQLFVLLGAFNGVIVAPAIARTPRSHLLGRYLAVLSGALVVCVAIMGVAIFFPRGLLWLIGEKYNHLEHELAWMMASSCAGYIAGVILTIHTARKWVFYWVSWAYIIVVILTQVIGLSVMDLGTTRNIFIFSTFSNVAILLVQAVWAVAGFAQRLKS